MMIEDRLYGQFKINSPALIELIQSSSIQRLKGIAQFGIPDEFYHLNSFSRYEHCVGVMLLLYKLGATEEEQIAGLLHDASHTAFSHIIDWVLESRASESHQDDTHLERLSKTEIPGILQRHGYSLEQICDYHRYGLLERDAPNICADRVDYGLREFDTLIAISCLPHLTVYNDQIVFDDVASASLFALNFLEKQKLHWGGFEGRNRYQYFSEAIRIAIESGDVLLQDFDHDDAFVIEKLLKCDNDRVKHLLAVLRSKSLVDFPSSGETILNKFRHVDPLFISGETTVRLSEVDTDFKIALELARENNAKGQRLVVI